MDAYRSGALSLEGQLDAIWAAVQQNMKHKSGIMIADDVGMGKSRTGAGFVMDQIQRGRKRVLVVTANGDNVRNLMDSEFPIVFGQHAKDIQMVEISGENLPGVKKGADPLPTYDKPTVYFVNSDQFADFSRKIVDARMDVVVVDEVHRFKNLDTKSRGPAWKVLHEDWVNRDVSMLYLSATPGVDIMDLAYLYGLKVWTMDGFGDWFGDIPGKLSPEQAKKKADSV